MTSLPFIYFYFLRNSFNHRIGGVTIVSSNKIHLKCFANLYQDLCDCIELINSTFTFHLIPIIVNSLLIKLFAAYGMLWEFKVKSPLMLFVFLQNSAWLSMQYFLQVLSAHAGSSLTKNAKETSSIVTRILNDFELSEELSIPLQSFIARSTCRNMSVENIFFVIDWKLLVQVISSYYRRRNV